MTSCDHEAFCRTTDIIYRKYFPSVAGHSEVAPTQRDHLAELKGRRPQTTYDCSVIIPVWNNAVLDPTMPQMHWAEVTDGVSYEVVVVDKWLDRWSGDIPSDLGAATCRSSAMSRISVSKAW